MENPVLVEVTRGTRVESAHRGAVSVVDAKGTRVASIGDVDQPVFPRSAVKAVQALLLVESGAADTYGFGDRELALACASHGGEHAHVALAEKMLGAAGLSEADLECGAHLPSFEAARTTLIRAGQSPTQLHNNCSGKHAGFLCAACHQGWQTGGYVGADHRVQKQIRAMLADVTAFELDHAQAGIDGCSIPTYAIPIERLAHGMVRMATGEGLAPERAKAATRLIGACQSEPFYTAGTGRLCTEAMEHFGRRVYIKTGAEGVFCGALPGEGLGIAVKADDGGGRASEAIIAAVLARLLRLEEGDPFFRRVHPQVLTVRGAPAGIVKPSDAFQSFLDCL